MAKKSSSPVKKILRIVLLFGAVLCLAAGWKIYEDVLSPNVNLPDDKPGYVFIHSGKRFDEIMEELAEQKILRSEAGFRRLVGILSYETRLKPGRYEVNRKMGNLELMRLLASGKQKTLDVTFIHAERKTDFAGFWSHQLEADSATLVEMLNDSTFAATKGLNTENVLTLFIPNTYNFYWNTHAGKLLKKLVTAYDAFWDSTRTQQAEALGLNRAQVSILASIVQKETARRDEMPVIAGVYYNRMKKGIPLGADPTIIFAMNDPGIRRVGGEMLNVESPYNTYRHKGLPPGPICVASVQAIEAVLNMSRHKYMYFCAREDFSGYHNFAESYAQHQLNARKWHRELNRRGVKL